MIVITACPSPILPTVGDEIVAVRNSSVSLTPSSVIRSGTGAVEMPRYDRRSLPPGHVMTGPAMVEDEWSTTVVYPGQRCVADRLGNLIIEVGGRA